GFTAERRHMQLAPQCGRRERNRQLTMQVVVVALEDLVLLDMDLDIEVAGRPAIDAGFAIAARSNTHTVIDTGRDLDLQGLVPTCTANAVARHTRIGDLLTAAVAGRAGLLDAEKALLHPHRTRTTAGVAGLGRRAGFCAAAVAGIAIFPAGHADFGVKALSGLLQRDFQRVFEVGATVYLRSTATAT